MMKKNNITWHIAPNQIHGKYNKDNSVICYGEKVTIRIVVYVM